MSFGRRRQGKVLILCVFTAAVVGVVLVSFLQLGQSHENYVARSQSWNLALPAAEAGLEEALTHLNYAKSKSLESNGWIKEKDGFSKKRVLNSAEYYQVKLNTDKKKATVTSTGYVRAPLSTNYISRTVVVTATKTNMIYSKAMIGRKHIRAGKGTLIDAYDSTDSKYSTGGKYDAAKRKDNADIASSSTKKNSISVEKTKVYGSADTGASGGVEFKNNASLGDATWVNGGKVGGQPGKVTSEFVYDYPPVEAPFTSGVPPSGGMYGKVDAQYVLTSGNWQLGTVSLKKPLVVATNATAVLYVTGDFKAEANIVISPGATLKLYMAGHKFEVKDKDVSINDNDPSRFQYYGLPSNKDVRFSKKGETAMSGLIYAPNAKIKMEGENDFYGSIVGKCIHMKHNGAFHYDDSLRSKETDFDIYIVDGWSED